MKINDLGDKLKTIGIPDWYYSVNCDNSDSFCIVQNADNSTIFWDVYYSERGNKYDLFRSQDENEACIEFLNRVKTSFKNYVSQGGKLE